MGAALKVTFDTNILIDYLNGLPQARDELARHDDPAISLITWMEILVGAADAEEEHILRDFLELFEVLPVDRVVAELAIKKRRQYRLRLPDALIWASAEVHHSILITRNTRDFPREAIGIHVPYQI
jgi:predicted nucleic acid-binding protein